MAAAVTIPLSNRQSLIIEPQELSGDVISILQRERAEYSVWIECARGLLSQGNVKAYTDLLNSLIEVLERNKNSSSSKTKFIHIQALCGLGDLELQQARLAKDRQDQNRRYLVATKFYSDATRIDASEMLPILGLGEASLSRGNISEAIKQFQTAATKKCNGCPSIAGTLALARLHFSQSNFSKALGLYQNALLDCPSAPPEVRLGIASCQLRMGEVSKAEAAYKRVLQLDRNNIQALLGLAVVEFSGATSEATQRGSRLLAQAFREDPHDPYILALLAHFSLQQNLAVPALKLSQAALARADVDDRALRAELTVLLARAHHANGELQEALKCYNEALSIDPLQPTAKLAKAQLDVAERGDLQEAVHTLEKVLDERAGWTDAVRVLAPLCPRYYHGATAARSAHHFKEAAQRESTDASLWEMLGDIIAGSDPASALSSYKTAINLHRKADNGSLPARLLNNAAVLELRSGNHTAALQLVNESIASAVAGGLSDLGPQAQVTLGYNAARMREAAGDLKSAENEYKALLEQFPQYADCHFRLAYTAKARGDIKAAEEWAQQAMKSSSRSADALCLLAGVALERRDYERAGALLEELRQHSKEPFSRVALGNLHLARTDDRHLKHSFLNYRKALERDPGNIFAANGLGCALAECGYLNEAKDIFIRVQEAAAGTDGFLQIPDAWINLANAYAGMRMYGEAEHAFIVAMKRFPEVRDDARVLLYLARVQYEGGRLEAALNTLKKAVHIAPRDHKMRFNLAYVMQKSGEAAVARKEWSDDNEKVKGLNTARIRVHAAIESFAALLNAGKAATGVKEDVLRAHVTYINGQLLPNIEQKLEEAQLLAEVNASKRRAREAKIEQDQMRRKQEEQRKKIEEEAMQRQLEAQAQEAAAKLERLKSEWKQGAVLAKAAAAGDASAVVKDRENKQKQQPDAMDALFAEEEDDEEYMPGMGGDSDGEDAKAGLQGTEALAAAGLISSDEEEGNDEDFEVPGEDEIHAEEAAAAAKGDKKKKKKKEKKGLLKKRARDEEAAAPAADNEQQAQEEGGEAKRAKTNNILEDSGDDDDQPATDPAKASMADLFGSDSE